ncbi:DUF2771 family protein [Amycolatopsis lurida]
MRGLGVLAVLAGGAFVLSGCSPVPPPEVTFFADGNTVRTGPFIHCDARVASCEQNDGAEARLKVRPGKPVQISLPKEIVDTPWLVNVQYQDAAGNLQPVKQEFFSPGRQHAYTATAGPGDQLVVVEIQQISAATAIDGTGAAIEDEQGNPQLVVRGIWTLQVEPA